MNSEEDKKSEKRSDKSKSSSDNDIIPNQEREEEEGNLCQRLNDFCELIRQKTENNKKKDTGSFCKVSDDDKDNNIINFVDDLNDLNKNELIYLLLILHL